MGFTTIVKPRLAERWRSQGNWGNETFFDILARRAELQHGERGELGDGGAVHVLNMSLPPVADVNDTPTRGAAPSPDIV